MTRRLYGEDDLFKLKHSKPVPIIAHTNEIVVPVVYASMVKKFLDEKGVSLPLTHKQLSEMKHEAQSLATGGIVQKGKQNQVNKQKVKVGEKRKKAKKPQPEEPEGGEPKPKKAKGKKKGGTTIRQKGKQNQITNQKVVIQLGGEQRNASGDLLNPSFNPYDPKQKGKPGISNLPNPPPQFPPSRPNYFGEIRPFSTAPLLLNPPDSKEREKEAMEKSQKEALDKYFKDFKRHPIFDILEQNHNNGRLYVPEQPLRGGGNYDFNFGRLERIQIEEEKEEKEFKEEEKKPNEPDIIIPPPIAPIDNREPLEEEEKKPKRPPIVEESESDEEEEKKAPPPKEKKPKRPVLVESDEEEEEEKRPSMTVAVAQPIYQRLKERLDALKEKWNTEYAKEGGKKVASRRKINNEINDIIDEMHTFDQFPFYVKRDTTYKELYHFRRRK
jgi:hypothetical protein